MVNKAGDLSGYFSGEDHNAPPAVPQSPTQLSRKSGDAPEIKVITHNQMAKEGTPPANMESRVAEKLQPKKVGKIKKKSGVSGKLFIGAVILLLIAVDIPIGLRIYQGYQNRNNIAQSDVSQDTGAAAEEPLTPPTPTPPTPTSQASVTETPKGAVGGAALSGALDVSPSPQETPVVPTATTVPTKTPTPTLTPVAGDNDGLGGGADGGLADAGVQTHSECFERTCIEVEGSGADACFVDSDCGDTEEDPTIAPTRAVGSNEVVQPDQPVAGSIRGTLVGIAAGIGTVLLALLILL